MLVRHSHYLRCEGGITAASRTSVTLKEKEKKMSEKENAVSTDVVNPLDIINKQVTDVDSGAATEDLGSVSTANWIPALNICYATSKSFKNSIAKPGEFVYGGQSSLGSVINVIALDYRLRAMHVDKDDFTFKAEVYHLSGSKTPASQDKVYQDFINAPVPSGCDLQVGSELLVYLPDSQQFASMLLKKTLANTGADIYKMSLGGRVVQLSTEMQENKKQTRVWYSINTKALNTAVVGSKLEVAGTTLDKSVALPADQFTKYYTIFNAPQAGVEKASESAPTRDR